jgi:hypothetical protein
MPADKIYDRFGSCRPPYVRSTNRPRSLWCIEVRCSLPRWTRATTNTLVWVPNTSRFSKLLNTWPPGRITILSWKPTTYQCPKGFSLTNGLTMSWN